MRRNLIAGVLVVVATVSAYVAFKSIVRAPDAGAPRDAPADRRTTEAPRSIDVSERAVILGVRGGKAVAIVDLLEVAPQLARLPASEIDRLVRAMLSRKAASWFAQEKFRSMPDVTIDVVTVMKQDEYLRPDLGSALGHGRVSISNSKGSPTEVVGKLDFARLIAARQKFGTPVAPMSAGGAEAGKMEPRQAPAIGHVDEVTPAQLASAKEQVVFDEFDFWQHPLSLSNVYSSFEPVIVRVKGAEYFFRNDTRSRPFAASGHRYAELRAENSSPTLMYVPRRLDFSGTLGYTFRVRKSNPRARVTFRVYLDFDRAATIREGASGEFPVIANTDWNEIRVPFSKLEFLAVQHKARPVPSWRDPDDFLSRYQQAPGYVFAIEFGLERASPKDVLYLDRIAVLRTPSGKPPGRLSGHLLPAAPGARVHIRGRTLDQVLVPDADGHFAADLPLSVKVVEIFAQVGKSMFAPKSGRFLEIGSYLPEIEIPTTEQQGDTFPVSVDMNSGIYDYDGPIGAHMRPGHYGFSKFLNGKIQFLLEGYVNRFGFIDRDRRLENPDRAFRVVVIGDSYYQGMWMNQQDAMWNQAEAIANLMTDDPIEVIMATNNHAPFINSWSQFKNYALRLKPNLVIIAMREPEILNFAVEDYVRDWLGFAHGHPPYSVFDLREDGKLLITNTDPNWRHLVVPISDEQHAANRKRIDARQFIRRDIENAPPWVRHALDTSAAALAKFVKEGRQNGVEVALGYSASTSVLNRMKLGSDLDLDPSLFKKRMRELAERSGMTFLDQTPVIYAEPLDEESLHVPGNSHWTSFAHYRAGAAIADEVLRRLKREDGEGGTAKHRSVP